MAEDVSGELSNTEDNRESLWQTVRNDLAAASGWRLLGVLGMLVWLAFQWGWGNDIVLPTIVTRVFEGLDDGESWPVGVAAIVGATAAGSLFWAITQSFDGFIVLTALGLLPGITERISRALRQQGWVKPYAELSFATRMLIAYASGASALCLIDVFATGESGLTNRRRMLTESVALAVVTVAVVIIIVTAAFAIGARVSASRGATEFVVRYARNPLTWIAIYGSGIAVSALVQRVQPKP